MCLIHKNTLEGYNIVCSKNAIQTTSVLRSWKFFRIYSKYSHWSIAYITYLIGKLVYISDYPSQGVQCRMQEVFCSYSLLSKYKSQAMNEWRIFILDHHDYLMSYLSKINTKGVCAYASRTLFFLRTDDTLKPLAIELSLPGSSEDTEVSRVFLPANQGTEAALWQLAKAHVAANDSAYHQLISHW
jgi:hypothetical protein